MVFGNKKIPHEDREFKIFIDGVPIGQVEHTKFLGVNIDEILNLTH